MPKPHSQVLLIAADQQNVGPITALLSQDQAFSHQLEQVDTLAEGLVSLKRTQQTSLVLMELDLPDAQGLDAFHQVYNQFPSVPLIILSHLSDEALALEALQEGAQDYLIKDQFDGPLFNRAIHYAIERQNQALALEEKSLGLQLLARQLEAAKQKLEQLSTVDELTQVYNRRHFDEMFLAEWNRLTRERSPLALIMCNVDGLETYNTTFGRSAGDQCLQEIARVLLRVVKRPADGVARYSGQQFVVLMPNTDLEGGTHVADLIKTEMSAVDFSDIPSREDNSIALRLGIASRIPSEGLAPSLLLEEVKACLSRSPSHKIEPLPMQETQKGSETLMAS